MDTEVEYCCILQGKFLDPTELSVNPNFLIKDFNVVGDLGKTGRYKDVPYDFGYLCFADKARRGLCSFLKLLKSCEPTKALKCSQTRELHVFISYKNQCNWEFSEEEIGLMNELGLTLTISCDRD